MGADIHFIVEKRMRVGDTTHRWVGIHDSDELLTYPDYHHRAGFPLAVLKDRNYSAFGRLAGVRSEGPAPNGIPADRSDMARAVMLSWSSDGHSHGHYSLEEFVIRYRGEQFAATVVGAKLTNAPHPVASLFGISAEELNDYRVIFWFDN